MKVLNPFYMGLLATIISCSQSQKKVEARAIPEKSLLQHVSLAINPIFQDWVLFENGTYIIFNNADTISDLKKEAIMQMEKFGPVFPGGSAGDFSITHLNETEGWVVSGHCYGMYTYVNPNEITNASPTDVEIGLYGRSKRNKDGEHPQILHVNRKVK